MNSCSSLEGAAVQMGSTFSRKEFAPGGDFFSFKS